LEVYSEKYKIAGKIDQFFIKEWKLVERKNKIQKIFLWYKYQLWWQMFCLEEMWYHVSKLQFYSMQDNKIYEIHKPNSKELLQFEQMLDNYRKYDILQKFFRQNTQKCLKCIYRELCDYFIWEVFQQLQLFDTQEELENSSVFNSQF
jgi:CRISPR-associated protein Cas4